MKTMQAAWGFYGRQREISQLRKRVDAGRFHMVAVIGGRGVGKTQLIKETLRSMDDWPPSVWLTLPDADRGMDYSERQALARECCAELAAAASLAGLGEHLHAESPDRPGRFLKKTFVNLLRAGAVVVLDEFQNAASLSLISAVRDAVEQFRHGTAVKGTLIVAGSHQQEMIRLLNDPRAALYGRPTACVRLRPLTAPELLEMAADQGWLDRPRRFLAAYAVFGGVPLHWSRLRDAQLEGDLPEPAGGDETWREMFLAHEVKRLRDHERERFGYRALVTLSEGARQAARMAAEHPRGLRWSAVVDKFIELDAAKGRETASKARAALEGHLLLIEPAGGEPGSKVRMADHRALFEMMVESIWPEDDPDFEDFRYRQALRKAADAEGFALERLAEQWIRTRPGVTWAKRNLTAETPGGSVEIDVAAGQAGDGLIGKLRIMASCKRSPDAHTKDGTAVKFRRFLEFNGWSATEGWPAHIRRLLVSPERPLSVPGAEGFERIGLKDMAGELGLEIRPWPSAEPEPETGRGGTKLTHGRDRVRHENPDGSAVEIGLAGGHPGIHSDWLENPDIWTAILPRTAAAASADDGVHSTQPLKTDPEAESRAPKDRKLEKDDGPSP